MSDWLNREREREKEKKGESEDRYSKKERRDEKSEMAI